MLVRHFFVLMSHRLPTHAFVPADVHPSTVEERQEFAQLAQRSDALLRELTIVRRRMDELVSRVQLEELMDGSLLLEESGHSSP
jgi:hypothetical protein